MAKNDSANPEHDSLALSWQDFTGRVRPGVDPGPLLELIGDDPLRSLAHGDRAAFVKAKYDKGSRVYCVRLDLGRGEEELFIKTFDTSETFRIMVGRMFSSQGLGRPLHYPRKLISMIFEPSRASRCWEAAGACKKAGIMVAEHLLFLSRGRAWRQEEVLVTRGIQPRSAPNAREYFNRNFSPPCPPEKRAEKRDLIQELGALLRRVRDSRIMFPDFKLHNLVLQEPLEGPPIFFVVDLSEAVLDRPDYPEFVFLERFSPHLRKSPAFTSADQVRLIKAYLNAGGDPRSWREVCEGIMARAREQGRTRI